MEWIKKYMCVNTITTSKRTVHQHQIPKMHIKRTKKKERIDDGITKELKNERKRKNKNEEQQQENSLKWFLVLQYNDIGIGMQTAYACLLWLCFVLCAIAQANTQIYKPHSLFYTCMHHKYFFFLFWINIQPIDRSTDPTHNAAYNIHIRAAGNLVGIIYLHTNYVTSRLNNVSYSIC